MKSFGVVFHRYDGNAVSPVFKTILLPSISLFVVFKDEYYFDAAIRAQIDGPGDAACSKNHRSAATVQGAEGDWRLPLTAAAVTPAIAASEPTPISAQAQGGTPPLSAADAELVSFSEEAAFAVGDKVLPVTPLFFSDVTERPVPRKSSPSSTTLLPSTLPALDFKIFPGIEITVVVSSRSVGCFPAFEGDRLNI